jgi:hypothetical protein
VKGPKIFRRATKPRVTAVQEANVNRKILSLLGAIPLTAAAIANGQTYIGTVLYPLTVPPGFTGISNTSLGSATTITDGQVVGLSAYANDVSNSNAFLWTTANPVNLNPAGCTLSIAYANTSSQQVGYASGDATDGYYQAMLWNGTAASAVDLNPNGFVESVADGTNGTRQVGLALQTAPSFTYAFLWNGTAASAVDLNPTDLNVGTIKNSAAQATDGSQQVGEIITGAGSEQHAVLWTGTAASAVDLNPTGLTADLGQMPQSVAVGVGGGQQVGSAQGTKTGNNSHAIVWSGTAASAVDLNPTNLPGFTASDAFATNGTQQVGLGYTNSVYDALLWNGTASSTVDLAALLPASGTWTDSTAYSIDSSGNIYGVAINSTYNGVTGAFAVEWSPVPEPGTGSLLLIAGAGLLARRQNRIST